MLEITPFLGTTKKEAETEDKAGTEETIETGTSSRVEEL